jgi:hypothetical protein
LVADILPSVKSWLGGLTLLTIGGASIRRRQALTTAADVWASCNSVIMEKVQSDLSELMKQGAETVGA